MTYTEVETIEAQMEKLSQKIIHPRDLAAINAIEALEDAKKVSRLQRIAYERFLKANLQDSGIAGLKAYLAK